MARTTRGETTPADENRPCNDPATGAHSDCPFGTCVPAPRRKGLSPAQARSFRAPASISSVRFSRARHVAMPGADVHVRRRRGLMDTRHLVESPLAAAPAAAAETLGTPVPATLGTRRDFCVAACQALSLGAIAATLQACGGGSNPNEPSGRIRQRPRAAVDPRDGHERRRDAERRRDGAGQHRRHRHRDELARHDARRPQRHGLGVGVHGDLHPSAVHGHRLHRRRLPVSVPRIAVQHQRRRRPRSGDAEPPPLQRHDHQRRDLDHRVAAGVQTKVGHPAHGRPDFRAIRATASARRRSFTRATSPASRRCRRRG